MAETPEEAARLRDMPLSLPDDPNDPIVVIAEGGDYDGVRQPSVDALCIRWHLVRELLFQLAERMKGNGVNIIRAELDVRNILDYMDRSGGAP